MRVDGAEAPPKRPLRLPVEQAEPVVQAVFREPRSLKRRQKKLVGPIDRWKNSGGKSAKVTLRIPEALQQNEAQMWDTMSRNCCGRKPESLEGHGLGGVPGPILRFEI